MTRPIRTCVVCRRKVAQSELVRVMWDERRQSLTISDRGVGRSAYACKAPACLAGLFQKGRIERALKRTVPRGALEALRGALLAATSEA